MLMSVLLKCIHVILMLTVTILMVVSYACVRLGSWEMAPFVKVKFSCRYKLCWLNVKIYAKGLSWSYVVYCIMIQIC